MVRTIPLLLSLRDDYVTSLTFLDDSHYCRKYLFGGEAVDVVKPDGRLLLALRPQALYAAPCVQAYAALCRAARTTHRRTVAAGGAAELYSGTVGCLYGEPTAFTTEDRPSWWALQPLLRDLNRVFREQLPDQYHVLADAAQRTPAERLIPQTVFTTVTANRWSAARNARMAAHPDSGNLEGAFAAMTVLESGSYSGALLVFPKYRVAVDVRTRDVLLADTHELHGNTDAEWIDPDAERVSAVCYYHASNLPD